MYTNIELILRITHSYQLNRLLTRQVLDVKAIDTNFVQAKVLS